MIHVIYDPSQIQGTAAVVLFGFALLGGVTTIAMAVETCAWVGKKIFHAKKATS